MQSIGNGCTGLLYLNLSYCYVTDSILRLLTKYDTISSNTVQLQIFLVNKFKLMVYTLESSNTYHNGKDQPFGRTNNCNKGT